MKRSILALAIGNGVRKVFENGAWRVALALGAFSITALGVCAADTISRTGMLASPEDTVLIPIVLTSAGDVTLQTYGFGGGANAAGTTIAAGGFDPFVGLFSGTGDGAVFVDGTSDILTNYTPGCPPAGTVLLGGSATCGDVNMQFTDLTAGTYTVLLSDGEYIPFATFEGPGGTFGDGFVDFTAGVFQTCDTNGDCNNDTANWALDITTSAGTTPSPTPEPPSVELVFTATALAGAWMYRRNRKTSSWIQGGSR
jgi:hypothetical protein